MKEYTELYIPVGVMRGWPTVEATYGPLLRQDVDTAPAFAPAVGYVPVYDSLDALRREHGDVPYTVARRPL